MSSLEAKKSLLYNFSGPMAAVATPFNAQGALDVTQIPGYARYLAKLGVKGVYILGTTGEGYSLTLQEKASLLDAWRSALDALPGSSKLTAVVNVSGTVVSEVQALAGKVEALGFDGIALLPPIYYTVSSKEQLVAYFRSILGGHAPTTPFLYYHIPIFTGELKFELEDFLELALRKIPQFSALKFTDANMIRFASVMSRFGGKINFFAGFDETLLATRTLGAKAAIFATLSFPDAVSHYLALVEATDRKDVTTARSHQEAIASICAKLRADGNFFATLKRELNKVVKGEGLFFGTPRSPIWIE